MKPILQVLAVLLLNAHGASAAPTNDTSKPEETFTSNVARAIDTYLDQRRPDFENPQAIRLFLISPAAYSDVEFAEARRAAKDPEPFWISGRPHLVFRAVTLSDADAKTFARCFYRDLMYQKSHEEFRLVSFCLFQPMHAFEITFLDGMKLQGAICVHCGDLMFQLPRPGADEYRGVQTKELIAALTKLLPIPENLEARFFPKK